MLLVKMVNGRYILNIRGFNMFSFLPWQKPVLLITMAMLFCLVGSYDIEQAEQTQALYCENVKAKVWPDYDKNIKCK